MSNDETVRWRECKGWSKLLFDRKYFLHNSLASLAETAMTDAPPHADAPPEAALSRLRTTAQGLHKIFTLLVAFNLGVLILLAVLAVSAEAFQHLLNIRVVGREVCGFHLFGTYQCFAPKGGVTGPLIAFNAALRSWKLALYAGVLILRNLPPLFILLRLRALCALYEDGIVFTQANVRHVEWIGSWIIFWAGTASLVHAVLSVMGADLFGQFKNVTDPSQVVLGLFGVGVLLAARVMKVGAHIEDERSQFV